MVRTYDLQPTGRAAKISDFVRIVGFSNTLTVTQMDIMEIFGFPQLALSAKYRLFLTYTAKHTQMSFSRCSLARFFAGRHCGYWHLYGSLRDAQLCGSASWIPIRRGSARCDRELPTYFSPASQILHLPVLFCGYLKIIMSGFLGFCVGQILGLCIRINDKIIMAALYWAGTLPTKPPRQLSRPDNVYIINQLEVCCASLIRVTALWIMKWYSRANSTPWAWSLLDKREVNNTRPLLYTCCTLIYMYMYMHI